MLSSYDQEILKGGPSGAAKLEEPARTGMLSQVMVKGVGFGV
jgi:hypothetical protein